MKRVVRSLLLFFCTTLFMLSASVCVCLVRVHADGATYANVSDECLEFNAYNISPYQYCYISISGSVRSTFIHDYTGMYYIYFISDSPFTYNVKNTSDVDSCLVAQFAPETFTQNGSTYYRYYVSRNNWLSFGNIPVHDVDSSKSNSDWAFYYSYGEGSEDPTPTPVPISWGLVDVKGYQTNVAGQGQASINNVDVISWDSAIDTNGNDITTGNVRIRFLPGEYRAETKNSLIQQTYNDFILDVVHATDGNVFPVTNGSASFKWSDVIDTLNLPFMSIYSLINENDAWLKRGWIYEIRLEIDDYVGEWQPIYASTSSGVENDMTIVNTTVITQETITAIQNINSINGTNNIWIINGQPVNPNPEVTPPADDDEKPWWVYLLEMINNTLGIQNEYINEGTDESIEIVNNFEEDHDDLNVTVNDYDDIENNIVNDMNDNLDDLDIESDLIENNSFVSSARWVAEQYTRITTDNPIGSILKFSLVLGFVMIFLGRFK